MKKDAILFLNEKTLEYRKSTLLFLKQKAIRVLAVYGDIAIEVLLDSEQRRILDDSDFKFKFYEQVISNEEVEEMSVETRQIAELWNYTQKKFEQLKTNSTQEAVSWSAKGYEAPLPSSGISREYFAEILQENGLGTSLNDNVAIPGNEKLRDIEQRLKESFPDPTRLYHLARLVYSNPELEDVLYTLPEEVIDQLFSTKIAMGSKLKPGFQGFGETCWRLLGEISVGIVFAESSQTGAPIFTQGDRILLQFEIVFGLNWLARQNLMDDTHFVYDFQFALIDVPNSNEGFWRPRAVEAIRYNGKRYSGDWTGIFEYREDLRSTSGSSHGFVMFVTPLNLRHFAYEVNRTVFLSNKDNYGGWGIEQASEVSAHECGHVFGAPDEYDDGCSDCFSRHGCDNVPNSNCADCIQPAPLQCIMLANSLDVCVHTIRHLGWRLPLTLSPRVINFGSVRVGERQFRTLRAKNRTSDNITLQFPGSGNIPLFNWDGFSGTLEPGEERSFTFSFRPVSNHIARNVFTITTSATGHRQYMGVVGKGQGGF